MKEKRWLKYLCLFVLAFLIAIPVMGTKQTQAATTSGSCGANATYKFDKSTGKLTISGSGTVKYTENWSKIASKVKKIVIGDQITAIADGTFWEGFSNVKTVTIGKKCRKIGAYAFEGCSKLTTVDMGNSSVTTIRYSAFQFCSRLKKVTFSKKLTSIGKYAFYDCTKLTAVKLPSSLKKIGEGAFMYSGLTGVTIPKKVTSIGTAAFSGCKGLTAIKVSSGNTKFSAKSGVLYNKSKTKLIAYPAGKTDTSYSIPSSVTKIAAGAFTGNKKLESVVIGANLKELGDSAFSECSKLATVTFEGSAPEEIGSGVFFDSTTTVRYPASQASSWTTSVQNALNDSGDVSFVSY